MKKHLFFFLIFFILVLFFGLQKVSAASEPDIYINEIMWMGSNIDSYDEWLELKNTGELVDFSQTPWSIYKNGSKMVEINKGQVPTNGFYVIARKGEAYSILNFTPDLVASISLNNSDVQYKLYDKADNTGNLIDTADDGAGIPLAGSNISPKASMERNDSVGDGTLAKNWHTAVASINFKDGATEKGTPTPGAKNSTPPKNNPPTEPVLVLPENNAQLTPGQDINFSWEPSTDADKDEVSYSLFVGCAKDLIDDDLVVAGQLETNYQFEVTKTCTDYYWQIVASDGQDKSASEPFIFTFKIPAPIVYSNAILINELMPDPSGDDATSEWIELFNNSSEVVNLKGWILEDMEGTTKKFPIGDIDITSFGFLVFKSAETHISLNNGSDGVRLYQPDSKLLDETSIFTGAKQDLAWARTSSGVWNWTLKPTAGEINIIELPPVDVGGDDEEIPVINKTPIKIKTKNYQLYQNKLVQIEGEVVETSGATFYLNDGSGKVKIYIQAATEITKPAMHKGDIFQIIGVVNLYRNTWRILPRAQEDILLIRAKNEGTITIVKKSTTVKQTAAKPKAINGSVSNARAPNPLTEPFLKEVKAAETQNILNPQNQTVKTPLWLEIIKLIIGLAVVFVILLLLKVRTMPRVKIIGGRFGQDDT